MSSETVKQDAIRRMDETLAARPAKPPAKAPEPEAAPVDERDARIAALEARLAAADARTAVLEQNHIKAVGGLPGQRVALVRIALGGGEFLERGAVIDEAAFRREVEYTTTEGAKLKVPAFHGLREGEHYRLCG